MNNSTFSRPPLKSRKIDVTRGNRNKQKLIIFIPHSGTGKKIPINPEAFFLLILHFLILKHPSFREK